MNQNCNGKTEKSHEYGTLAPLETLKNLTNGFFSAIFLRSCTVLCSWVKLITELLDNNSSITPWKLNSFLSFFYFFTDFLYFTQTSYSSFLQQIVQNCTKFGDEKSLSLMTFFLTSPSSWLGLSVQNLL